MTLMGYYPLPTILKSELGEVPCNPTKITPTQKSFQRNNGLSTDEMCMSKILPIIWHSSYLQNYMKQPWCSPIPHLQQATKYPLPWPLLHIKQCWMMCSFMIRNLIDFHVADFYYDACAAISIICFEILWLSVQKPVLWWNFFIRRYINVLIMVCLLAGISIVFWSILPEPHFKKSMFW